MKFRLVRDTLLADATLGKLSVVDQATVPVWETLEDADRKLEDNPSAKIKGATAIPRGTYRLILAYSTRFARVTPRLLDVPGYTGILIHSGNTVADTEGCILVGEVRDGERVLRSREAMRRLMALLAPVHTRGEDIEIQVM